MQISYMTCRYFLQWKEKLSNSDSGQNLQVIFSPLANGWDLGFGFFELFGSLRQINFESEDIVENVAGTTFDKIAPISDLLLSTESLQQSKINY